MTFGQDINENDILTLGRDILDMLLLDRTTGKNITWVTSDYETLGGPYAHDCPILPHLVTGVNNKVVMPRVLKTREQQSARSKDMAEVFTPSWVCNAQNNLIDEAWFGRSEVFNTEMSDEEGGHFWITKLDPIDFPETLGKSWEDYVRDVRMEITCGEAPYLVSRYDTTTGEYIKLANRIGLLDRKLRIVEENTTTHEEWLQWAEVAYQSTYGYELQGDNLLLAREALLWTFIEYYEARFSQSPAHDILLRIAEIISWNLWQMDGLKCTVPNTCRSHRITTYDLFGEVTEEITPCKGCLKGDIHQHNGQYCLIRDWTATKKQIQRFVDSIKS